MVGRSGGPCHGLFRDCSGDSVITIDKAGDGFSSTGPHHFSQTSTGCLDHVHTYQTRRRVWSTATISHGLHRWRTAVTTPTPPAPAGAFLPLVTHPGTAPSTSWAMSPPDVRCTLWSCP